MSGAPLVALVAAPDAGAPARPLVAALARRARVTARPEGGADALLAVGRPAPPRVRAERTAVLADGRVTVGGTGEELAVPGPATVRTATLPPLPPHVRARWRVRLGLPDTLVVDTAALATEDLATALALASAAVVDLRHLPTALALGCPTAADGAAARALGATDGDHLVVGGREEAEALAADPHRAARASRRARRLAEDHLDADRAAARLLEAWGLARPRLPPDRVAARLDRLGTPSGAPVRVRAAAALALFAPTDPEDPHVHPSIRLASATRLGAGGHGPDPARPGRLRARVRRAGGAVLDRVGDRAAAATAEQVEALRDELERTRAELRAEIELLRAELDARSNPSGS